MSCLYFTSCACRLERKCGHFSHTSSSAPAHMVKPILASLHLCNYELQDMRADPMQACPPALTVWQVLQS